MTVRIAPVALLVAIVISACTTQASLLVPSNAPSSSPTTPPPTPSAEATATASVRPTASPSAPIALFGTWRRIGSCTAFVDAMRSAGLIDLVGTTDGKWMGGGITPGDKDPKAANYCHGATAVEHSHFFTADGRFGSYDERGQQVDDGTFELRGDDQIVFDQIVVTYRVDASDHLSFLAVVSPDCSSGAAASPSAGTSVVEDATCQQNHGWAISAFYPGSYERAP